VDEVEPAATDASQQPVVIAIDGPSGSGKSSTAKEVAARLGALYVDTGAMYRAVTWWVLNQGIDTGNAQEIGAALRQLGADTKAGGPVELSTDPSDVTVRIAGNDVTLAIREPSVGAAVSAVSSVAEVRGILVAQQRACVHAAQAAGQGVVMEGRDIGTVVLPDADVKIFLTADVDARARRRSDEDAMRGTPVSGDTKTSVAATRDHLEHRDRVDSSRDSSPLRPAGDAVTIDSTQLTLMEVVERVITLVDATMGRNSDLPERG